MRRLAASLAVALLLPVTASAATKPPPHVEPPSAPCNEDHIFDIQIVHGKLFECACESMPYGPPVCNWYEVTSPAHDPMRIKRPVKHKRLVPVLTIVRVPR